MDDVIRDNLDVDGPRWNQKYFIAYRIANHNWLTIHTHSRALQLVFHVKKGAFVQSEVAELLGIEEFNQDDSLSEKLGLPSSVRVQNRNEITDFVILRIKDDFKLESKEFHEFLKKTYSAAQK